MAKRVTEYAVKTAAESNTHSRWERQAQAETASKAANAAAAELGIATRYAVVRERHEIDVWSARWRGNRPRQDRSKVTGPNDRPTRIAFVRSWDGRMSRRIGGSTMADTRYATVYSFGREVARGKVLEDRQDRFVILCPSGAKIVADPTDEHTLVREDGPTAPLTAEQRVMRLLNEIARLQGMTGAIVIPEAG